LPHDVESQRTALELALTVLQIAPGPRTTVQTPIMWPGDPHAWKRDMMNLSDLDEDQAGRARAAFEEQKRLAGLSSP
jgi:hypothetical protein